MIIDYKGNDLESAVVRNSKTYKGKEELDRKGFNIISMEENAGLRTLQGIKSQICIYGNFTCDALVYTPIDGKFLVKDINNPLIKNFGEAFQLNMKGEEFYINKNKLPSSYFGHRLNHDIISTKEIIKSREALYLFGDSTEGYGKMLYDNKIKEIPIFSGNYENRTFMRLLVFLGLGAKSQIMAVRLNWFNVLRGIRFPHKNDETGMSNHL